MSQINADTLVTLIAFVGIGGPMIIAALLVVYIGRTAMLERWGRQ